MVTTYKTESENKEIQDKVRARAMVTTGSGEGMAKLGQLITKLMATLTKAGQDNSPSGVPSSSKERGHRRGCNSSSTLSHPNSYIGRSGPGQTNLAHSLPIGCGTVNTGKGGNGQSGQGPSTRREGTANCWDPNSLQCFRC